MNCLKTFHRLLRVPVSLMVGLAVLGSAPLASAQQIPAGCNGSGISISIFAFLADGTTPAVGIDATECETLVYKAFLGYAEIPPNNCAFQEGHLIITTPDGVEHDVTPPGGIFDPLNPGGPLQPGSGVVEGLPVTYVVTPADVVAGQVVAATSYNQSPNFAKGISFTGSPPSVGFNNGGSSIGVNIAPCPTTFCAPQLCDPNATDPNIPGRQGLCVAGTPPVCTTLDPICREPFCDLTTDMCSDRPIVPTPAACLPQNPCGNNGDIRLAARRTPAQRAAAGTDLDKLRLSMRPTTTDEIDPTGKDVTVQISNASGIVFSTTLPAGSLRLSGRYHRYTNRAAKTAGGISRLTIWQRPNGQNQIYVDAWGDLSSATSHMLSTVTIGDTSYSHEGTWKPMSIGWRVRR